MVKLKVSVIYIYIYIYVCMERERERERERKCYSVAILALHGPLIALLDFQPLSSCFLEAIGYFPILKLFS